MSNGSTPEQVATIPPKKRKPGRPPADVIKVEVPDFVPKKHQETDRYWIGSIESCPYQNPVIASIDFPRWTGAINQDDSGDLTPPLPQRGVMIDLTKNQVNLIKAAVVMKVIRIVDPTRNRGQMLNRDGRHYIPTDRDRSLAEYVWMHRAETMGPESMKSEPETMAK